MYVLPGRHPVSETGSGTMFNQHVCELVYYLARLLNLRPGLSSQMLYRRARLGYRCWGFNPSFTVSIRIGLYGFTVRSETLPRA